MFSVAVLNQVMPNTSSHGKYAMIDTIAVKSTSENCAQIAINNTAGSFYYKKNYNDVTTTKSSTEPLN